MRANRSIPRATVIPELAYPDITEAARWLNEAFGFTVRVRIANHRIQLNVGDGAVVLIEPRGPIAKGSVMVRVEDVDAHHTRATKAGARILDAPTTYPYGERQYATEDFAGHRWKFSQSVADVAPEDWGGVSETRETSAHADAIGAAQRCLDDFMAAFNTRDLEAFERTFNFPSVRLASGTLTMIEKGHHKPEMLERGALKDWHHSAWDRREIIHAGPDKVHIDTRFTRYRADGSVIASFDSIYVITRENGHWGVKSRSSFAP